MKNETASNSAPVMTFSKSLAYLASQGAPTLAPITHPTGIPAHGVEVAQEDYPESVAESIDPNYEIPAPRARGHAGIRQVETVQGDA